MANSDLIKGAGFVGKSEGFVNYAEAINVPNPVQGENFYIKERERKQATKSRVNGYIENLKSDIDLDGLSPEQTSAMRGFLVSQRGIYANAANEIAKIDDASSPEYQHYADIMNGVNRSFVNLSEEVKSYKDAKRGFAETHQADLYSNAASGSEIQTAASLYGLDPEVPASFSVGEGGHIMFEVNGESQSYKDYKEPMMKDYKTMNSLLTTTNDLYSAGQKLNDTKIQLIGSQVEGMLGDPNTIKSILAGDFKGAGINLDGIAYNPEDIAGTRMQVKDAIVSALITVANEGYAEKERVRRERNPEPSNPNNANSDYSATQNATLNKLSVVSSNPNVTITIPNQSGRFKFHEPTGSFIKVNSDGQFDDQGNGNFIKLTLEDFAGMTGVKVEDIQTALGIN